ncbi:unnamed protein product [Staurois parvus]|uniref:Uncharacterized protein n=1 Tax=Staurois parvus TaxID=386267 RepID=A0ABN9GSD4_9NEOB|nr:unnamed protein product [Staurois parvus]
MLVQYLTDAHYFALKIEEAIDVISKMMYEAASSVVQEVIEFFVTVSQFGGASGCDWCTPHAATYLVEGAWCS